MKDKVTYQPKFLLKHKSLGDADFSLIPSNSFRIFWASCQEMDSCPAICASTRRVFGRLTRRGFSEVPCGGGLREGTFCFALPFCSRSSFLTWGARPKASNRLLVEKRDIPKTVQLGSLEVVRYLWIVKVIILVRRTNLDFLR